MAKYIKEENPLMGTSTYKVERETKTQYIIGANGGARRFKKRETDTDGTPLRKVGETDRWNMVHYYLVIKDE